MVPLAHEVLSGGAKALVLVAQRDELLTQARLFGVRALQPPPARPECWTPTSRVLQCPGRLRTCRALCGLLIPQLLEGAFLLLRLLAQVLTDLPLGGLAVVQRSGFTSAITIGEDG
jgi:hypothetical protein